MTDYNNGWHLSKSIPITIILFLIVQTVALVTWAAKIDLRVQYIEARNSAVDVQIEKINVLSSRLALIEDRQVQTIRRLDIQTSKLDQLLGYVLEGRKLNTPNP